MGRGPLSNPEGWPASAPRDSELILPLQYYQTPSYLLPHRSWKRWGGNNTMSSLGLWWGIVKKMMGKDVLLLL